MRRAANQIFDLLGAARTPWHRRALKQAIHATAVALVVLLLLPLVTLANADTIPAAIGGEFNTASSGRDNGAPNHEAQLTTARRLLRDAKQWADFGNLAAARGLAHRAAAIDVVWPAGEPTPQNFLRQLDTPEAPATVNNPREAPAQAASYQAPDFVPATSLDAPTPQKFEQPLQTALVPHRSLEALRQQSSVEQHLAPMVTPNGVQPSASTNVAPPFPSDAGKVTPRPAPTDAAEQRPSEMSQAELNNSRPMEQQVLPQAIDARAEATVESDSHSRSSNPPETLASAVTDTAHQPKGRNFDDIALPFVFCLLGLIMCPIVIVIGTVVAFRFLGTCSPVIRVEFIRHGDTTSAPATLCHPTPVPTVTPRQTERVPQVVACGEMVNEKAPVKSNSNRFPEPNILSEVAAFNFELQDIESDPPATPPPLRHVRTR